MRAHASYCGTTRIRQTYRRIKWMKDGESIKKCRTFKHLQTSSNPRRVSVGSWYPGNPMSSRVKICQDGSSLPSYGYSSTHRVSAWGSAPWSSPTRGNLPVPPLQPGPQQESNRNRDVTYLLTLRDVTDTLQIGYEFVEMPGGVPSLLN